MKFVASFIQILRGGRVQKIKESWTAEWARSLPPHSVFYDVGANIGIFSLLAAENTKKQIQVLAFEPALTNFPSLVENIRLNGLSNFIYPFGFGLGAATSFLKFNYQNSDPGGSLHSFGDIIQFKPNRSTDPVISIFTLCYALDDFVKMAGIPFPTHLKIDVDGMELQILEGSSKILKDMRLKEVQVESVDFSKEHLTSTAIIEFMAQHELTYYDKFAHNSSYPLVLDLRFSRR